MDIKTIDKSTIQPVSPPKPAIDRTTDSAREQKLESREPTPKKPGPVVNAQGQLTGRHLNVTA
jgi:hypothetical protein